MASERYELTRSIIHECPAVKLPQTLLQQIGMTAQILPLRGFTEEQARRFVGHLNAGVTPISKGETVERDGCDPSLLLAVIDQEPDLEERLGLVLHRVVVGPCSGV